MQAVWSVAPRRSDPVVVLAGHFVHCAFFLLESRSSFGADQHKSQGAQHDVGAEIVPNAVKLRSLVA